MANSKTTKRALFSSAVSLLLCFTMLMGATFAWFTDNVSSTGNRIQAGNLKVDLVMYDGNEYTSIADGTGDIFSEAGDGLWEPGKTQVVYLGVRNLGSLALKYNMLLDIIDGDPGLVGSLEYVIIPEAMNGSVVSWADAKAKGSVADVAAGQIVAAPNGVLDEIVNDVPEETDYFALAVHMKEEAGNEYQDGNITIDVNVAATQKDAEEDSFGPDYDKDAPKVTVTPETAQAAIHEAQPGDSIYLSAGTYDTLVIENADGTPKKGITIEHDKPGTNPTSNPFSVGHINLNASENITIKGIYFDITKAETVYSKKGATDYVASITGSKNGGNTGAKNIVIDNCRFNGTSAAASNYVAICFEEQGRPTSRATNITVKNCKLDKEAFNFVRMNYMAQGLITIENNSLPGGTAHSALNFTGNAADLIIRGNTFGFDWLSSIMPDTNGWNPEKAMLGTSRQGDNHIEIKVTGNTFIETLEGEGVVIDLKSSYTKDNCSLVFEGNTFAGGLAGMTEETVPCNRP